MSNDAKKEYLKNLSFLNYQITFNYESTGLIQKRV